MLNFFDDFTIENTREAHEHFRGARRAASRAVAYAVAILTEISRGQRYMERHGGHRFTCSF
jgi:hypothetical protein